MKRGLLFLLLAFGVAPASFARNDHVQIGALADYFHLSQTHTDFAGLGGRIGFSAHKNLKLESELNYDFNQVFTEGFTDNSTISPTVSITRSNVQILHGVFGRVLDLGHHSFHPFLTLKGGLRASFSTTAPQTSTPSPAPWTISAIVT